MSHLAADNTTKQYFPETKSVNYYAKPCMPRLIARLLKSIQDAPLRRHKSKDIPSKSRRKPQQSLRRPLPSTSLTPSGRSKSILLDSVNPITDADAFKQHKSLPPKPWIEKSQRCAAKNEYDQPRDMSDEERSWWASPYCMSPHLHTSSSLNALNIVRMISSPIRECMVTQRHLPKDFLIRLSPMYLPTLRFTREVQYLVPDGLEHPRYNSRRGYTGSYILCWRQALTHLEERGKFNPLTLCFLRVNYRAGYYKRLAPNLNIHVLLGDQIGHLLRLRVLQELELLADRLQTRPPPLQGGSTLIRKLTREEWKSIKTTKIIPFPNAIAVIVATPLNRNPITKARPPPTMDLLEQEEFSAPSHRPLPLSILHPVAQADHSLCDSDYHLPATTIPFYNSLTLFPKKSQRAALYQRLTRLLMVERRARYVSNTPQLKAIGDKKEKASHAFLLCSDETTAMRTDMAALAIALWRVRMWEGAGWEEFGGGERGWECKSRRP